jgi:hypothetical protein
LVTGVLFGALLQQGRVLRYEKQVGAMLFKDMLLENMPVQLWQKDHRQSE